MLSQQPVLIHDPTFHQFHKQPQIVFEMHFVLMLTLASYCSRCVFFKFTEIMKSVKKADHSKAVNGPEAENGYSAWKIMSELSI
jgi:hypothetical protein